MTKARIAPGPPSLCWHCLRQLQRAPGKGLNLFYFEIVRDRDGVEHRVHQSPCLAESVADGNKHIKETT